MALITRVALASIDANTAKNAPQLSGLIAGQALDVAAPCYIASADGLVYMSNATAADEEAEVVGFTARHVHSGEPVTLFGIGTRFRYGTALTPGNILYLGATDGCLDDGPTVGDAFGYAAVVSATDIVVIRGQPVLTSATVGDGTITAAKLAANSVETAKILAANVTQAKLEVGAAGAGITGLVVKFVADANVIGGIPVIHCIAIADASANTDVAFTHKTQVLAVWFVATGIAGHATDDHVKVTNVTAGQDVTEEIAKTATVNSCKFAQTILAAGATIAAGATVRATAVKVTNVAGLLYILGIRVA